MYIHLGNNKLISDRSTIGIFNRETLELSEENLWVTEQLGDEDKAIAIDEHNRIQASSVSPFTVIKRIVVTKDIIWSRENE